MIPDGIEPLVGWRYWRLNDEGLLTAVHQHSKAWKPSEVYEATCVRGGYSHPRRIRRIKPVLARFLDPSEVLSPTMDYQEVISDAPEERCECGVYAAESLERLREIVAASGVGVVGEVYQWGKLIPGQRGSRSQFAYPKSLYLLDDDPDKEASLLAYGVPVGRMERSKAEPLAASPMVAVGQAMTSWTLSFQEAAKAFAAMADSLKKVDDVLQEKGTSLQALADGDYPKRKPPPWYQRFDNPRKRARR